MSNNYINTEIMDAESKTQKSEETKAFSGIMDEKTKLETSATSLVTESHLQSLGFVITNGRPSFKLEEAVDKPSSMPPTDFSMVDEDDTLSFVVLGKDSLDSIHAMTLASYVDIQQKTMSVDYNSMISPLSSTEMHQKLTELLQENTKLKETLKQNNMAMKQQFNMLVTWQEEVLKVHQNHKQKFEETRELINRFKKENAELRSELHSYTNNLESMCEESGLLKSPNKSKQADESMLVMGLTERIMSLTTVLNHSKQKSDRLLDYLMSLQLKQPKCMIAEHSLVIKETETVGTNNDLSKAHTSEENDISCFQCDLKEGEINKLRDSNKILEEKLQCAFAPITIFHEETFDPLSINRQQYIQNVKTYNKVLEELSDCFAMQQKRFTSLQKCIKEITDIFEMSDVYQDISRHNRGFEINHMDVTELGQKLSTCYKDLLQEQLKLIDDRQNIFKAQKHIQKVLFDYNAVLCELEIIIERNSKLTALKNNIAQESCQKIAELEKNNMENKQTLEEQKKVLDQEKECLEEEKRSLEYQKKSLDTERNNLLSEKQLVEQERVVLNEEKMSLDQQSQLYENYEKAFHEEKKILETRNNQLIIETNMLHKQLQKMELEIRRLQQEAEKYEENAKLLAMQLNFYEEDFKQERKIKEALLEEAKNVDADLRKQMKLNEELQTQGGLNTRTQSTFVCPNCDCQFSHVDSLNRHVMRCLNID